MNMLSKNKSLYHLRFILDQLYYKLLCPSKLFVRGILFSVVKNTLSYTGFVTKNGTTILAI